MRWFTLCLVLLCAPGLTWSLEFGGAFNIASGDQVKGGELFFVDVGTPSASYWYLSVFPHDKISLGGYTLFGYTWTNHKNYPNSWYRRIGLISSVYKNGRSKDGWFLSGQVGRGGSGDMGYTKAHLGIGYQTVRDHPFVYKAKLRYARRFDSGSSEVTLSLVFARRFER